ncbi:class I fructose-bisphosphate aldolase [Paenibacillus sp. NEAU-GSW1]|uniref:class I fructose-bisphosphate aldolase n=1 Tax=Paenibacillus sp. NEAU-GSW1 TaxID=2682486 RepID=UPI0012E2E6C7|nr:deoxyribose-phosphate aldolase [Paenibacillus sp. NEAU-GSW1]MUT64888.1 deoxyribose-phosphate aldolase [Paenibacillus sp. NEAU-GSW1]
MDQKTLRFHRLFHSVSDRSILLPLDHGTTTGPTFGLKKVPEIVSLAAQFQLQGVVAHKGVIQWAVDSGREAKNVEYLLHLSASTSLSGQPSFKQTVSTIRHGLRIGVTGISMHINLGVPNEAEMLKELGRVSEEAYQWGLPLLAMFNIYEESGKQTRSWKKLAHAVRIAGELGADLVKVPMCSDPEYTSELIQAYPIPVLLAGGEQSNDKLGMLSSIYQALQDGARGICMGRNVFEDRDPRAMCRALHALVHAGAAPEEAMMIYTQPTFKELSVI